jgi:hypothetical protein
MNDVKYDFEVPLPAQVRNGRKPGVFYAAIRNMPKGASLFFAGARQGQIGGAHGHLKRRGYVKFRIATRKVVENDISGIRVWRLDAE